MATLFMILFGLSIGMFFNSMIRYRKFSIPSRKERESYRSIAAKEKEERTEEEQETYLQLYESIFSLVVAKYSFYLWVLLLVGNIIWQKI